MYWLKCHCSGWRRWYLAFTLVFLLAGMARAESGGALLYYLNCQGCHPMPEHDHGAFGADARFVGAFYQTVAGRRFFIRMPRAGSSLTTGEDALLVNEIATWKGACLALTASTPLIRYRHRSGSR